MPKKLEPEIPDGVGLSFITPDSYRGIHNEKSLKEIYNYLMDSLWNYGEFEYFNSFLFLVEFEKIYSDGNQGYESGLLYDNKVLFIDNNKPYHSSKVIISDDVNLGMTKITLENPPRSSTSYIARSLSVNTDNFYLLIPLVIDYTNEPKLMFEKIQEIYNHRCDLWSNEFYALSGFEITPSESIWTDDNYIVSKLPFIDIENNIGGCNPYTNARIELLDLLKLDFKKLTSISQKKLINLELNNIFRHMWKLTNEFNNQYTISPIKEELSINSKWLFGNLRDLLTWEYSNYISMKRKNCIHCGIFLPPGYKGKLCSLEFNKICRNGYLAEQTKRNREIRNKRIVKN